MIMMIEEKSWKEFRDSGLLWWVNSLLHVFGWALVAFFEDEELVRVVPARTNSRGFTEETNTTGYIKVSKYMVDNASDLLEESEN